MLGDGEFGFLLLLSHSKDFIAPTTKVNNTTAMPETQITKNALWMFSSKVLFILLVLKFLFFDFSFYGFLLFRKLGEQGRSVLTALFK